ncbi:MAG: glycoside hydrolase family 2 TIM barrel-domain containing protein [Enterococcus sp.]
MKSDITWLDTPEVFRIGQCPAHSDHEYFASYAEYQQKESSFIQSLNGSWFFCFSKNAEQRPKNFYLEEEACTSFDSIQVPQHIELAGYDKIHYINTMYPWEGHAYRRPKLDENESMSGMFSQAEYNPVGSYVRNFDLDEGLLQQEKVILHFSGVEQAMYVWLNGSFVGYAEDSFTPSEFDLTPFIKEKNNKLAVEVHKRSTAAFLEDQDFFRFFGIFREVYLAGQPQNHLADLWIRPTYDVQTLEGTVAIQMKFTAPSGRAKIKITADDGQEIGEKSFHIDAQEMTIEVDLTEKIALWDNEHPTIYTCWIEVYDTEHHLVEVIPNTLAFRTIELVDKIMYLNGKRLIINGVNRHEWSAESGRTVTKQEEQVDIECFKRNNINAVRTSHYPNNPSFYRLCDENGIYMMAETNLESHGSWQKMGAVEPSWNVPGSSSVWEAATLDRAKTNFETFKNHPSILFWSLGNESYAGDVLAKMNRYYKEQDPGRLTHYEGVFRNPAYKAEISDMESQMYTTPEDVRSYLESDPQKPFILCEYMHDMGNSLGGLGSYMQLLDKYPMYQGGFIWDFIDQALYRTDPITNQRVLRYGGDFDDRPSDYEFSGNGIMFANRVEKPAVQEVRYYYGQYK